MALISVQKFMAQDESSMMFHPHVDQRAMLWLNNILSKTYFCDTRLHHEPPASIFFHLSVILNFCDICLGVHGAYDKTMRSLGLTANDNAKDFSTIPEFSSFCKNTKFDYHAFYPKWKYEPKPCKDNLTWDLKDKMCLRRKPPVKECSLDMNF